MTANRCYLQAAACCLLSPSSLFPHKHRSSANSSYSSSLHSAPHVPCPTWTPSAGLSASGPHSPVPRRSASVQGWQPFGCGLRGRPGAWAAAAGRQRHPVLLLVAAERRGRGAREGRGQRGEVALQLLLLGAFWPWEWLGAGVVRGSCKLGSAKKKNEWEVEFNIATH